MFIAVQEWDTFLFFKKNQYLDFMEIAATLLG